MKKSSHWLLALSFTALLLVFGSAGVTRAQNEEEPPASDGSNNGGGGPGYTLYRVMVDGNQYLVRYLIINGSIQDMTVDKDTKSLNVILGSGHQKGELQLELEREFIDAKDQDQDVEYNVFIDGSRVDFEEVEKTERSRFMTIPFESNANQITITGTQVVPEFAPLILMAIVVLTISSVIILGRVNHFRSGK